MKWKVLLAILLKRLLPPLIGVGVLLVSILVAGKFVKATFEWRQRIQPTSTEVNVRRITPDELRLVDEVHEVRKQYYKEAIGTLKAASRTEISSRILAPIERVNGRAGDTVQAGDPLIVLDGQRLRTKLSQAQASLTAAGASRAQAKDEYERGLRLQARDTRAITAERLNQLSGVYHVAHANEQVARQAVREAEVLLSYTTITAPKDGMIVDRLAEPGDVAQPGVPLLVLYDPTSLRLEVPVMEELAVVRELGETLTVHIDAQHRDVEAVVDEIVPQAEAASRSFLIKVLLPRSEDLFEGMAGRLQIPAGERRHLCLNVAAIERIGQLEFVNVVGNDGAIQRRLIKTGRIGMPGRIEVLGGLAAGERVLLRPSRPAEQSHDKETGPVGDE